MKFLVVCGLALFVGSCGLTQPEKNMYDLDLQPEVIRIFIKDQPLQALQEKRKAALEAGVLLREKGDWVPALIAYKGKSKRASIRLKGDLSDHWEHEKHWSLKVRMQGGETIQGMTRFALQHPKTRGFMNEWVLHKFLSYTGLIALKYEFINISVNGEAFPIYAIEENIHRYLTKRHERAKGLLFKFNGDFYWRHKPGLAPRFYGATITPFNENNVLKDAALKAQLKEVRSSIEGFRNGEVKTHEIFNSIQLANLFAAIDIMGHHHATALDNIRFYYNPDDGLIEPIGYDNQLISDLPKQGLLGAKKIKNGHRRIEKWNLTNDYWYQYLFADSVFMDAYVQNLKKMSEPEYLDKFFQSIRDEFDETYGALQNVYKDYEFENRKVMYSNRDYIRKELETDVTLGYSDGWTEESNYEQRVKHATYWKGEWSKNMALVDLTGCALNEGSVEDIVSASRRPEKLTHAVISSDVCASYFQSSSGDNGLHLRSAESRDQYRAYIKTLFTLASSASPGGIAWYDTYFKNLNPEEQATVTENKKYLLDYLRPYKAINVVYVGTNSPAESIVMIAQNIHKLPMHIRSVAIDGVAYTLDEEVIVGGYINGLALPTKRFEVKLGMPRLIELAKTMNDPSVENKEMVAYFSVYGMEEILTERVREN